MQFPGYFRKLREARDISKTELARKLNLSIQYIVEVESGRSKPPTLDRCQQIAEALKLTGEEKNNLINLAVRERATEELKPFIAKEPHPAYETPSQKNSARKEKSFVRIPLLGSFPAADPLTFHKAERWIDLPEDLVANRKIYLLRLKDESMEKAGIRQGDVIIVEENAQPKKGETVVVQVGTGTFIKRYFRYGKTFVFESLDPKDEKLEFESPKAFKFRGILRGVLWKGFLK